MTLRSRGNAHVFRWPSLALVALVTASLSVSALAAPRKLAAKAAPQQAQLSVVFVPKDAGAPAVVVDFSARSNGQTTARAADIALFVDGKSVRKAVKDEAIGQLSMGQHALAREFLPTPDHARLQAIDNAWMITLQEVGEWEGPRPSSSRPLDHDGPAVVSPTTARLAVEGTLLDLPAHPGTPVVTPAILYGTWRSVAGHAVVRRGEVERSTLVLLVDEDVRVVGVDATAQEQPFVVDTRSECGRPLPVASVTAWRNDDDKRLKRAQLVTPSPWACGERSDIAVVGGETRKGTRSIPLHGIWLRVRTPK